MISIHFTVSHQINDGDEILIRKFDRRIKQLILFYGVCYINAHSTTPIGNVNNFIKVGSTWFSGEMSKYETKMGENIMGYITGKLELYPY